MCFCVALSSYVFQVVWSMWAAISWLFLNCFRELRIACTVAQLEREGGVSPRISPLAQVHLKVAFNGWIVVGLGKVTWHDLPRTVKRGGLGRENKGCAEVFHWKFISTVFHDGGHILHCLESSLLGALLPICCNSTGLTHFSSNLQDRGNMISVLILRKPPWVSAGAGA